VRNRFPGEQVVLELPGKTRVLAPYPLQHHGGMLFFLVTIVFEDGLEVRVLACIARWLYQSTASSSSIRETMARCMSRVSADSSSNRLVITDAGHCFLLMMVGFLEARWAADRRRLR